MPDNSTKRTPQGKPRENERAVPDPHDVGRGDNPGVGGLPAEGATPEEEIDSGRADEPLGDNPGVGGLPARELRDADRIA